jgi:anaerobic magnesium-protoporphyrin IX monomethyl ester cyclase
MKVTLITPPSDFLLDQRVFVSLGILKVGASLRAAGVDVDHLDLTGVSNYLDVVRDYKDDAIFAITATTPQMPAAVKIARECNGLTILGGPHVTLLNAARKLGNFRALTTLSQLSEEFTCLVCGDGELAIFDAMLEGDGGLIDADDPKSELWQSSQRYAESPWPDRSLVDMSSYHYTIDGVPATSMISQLGCPFECGFCGGRFSPMLRRIRKRPSDSVIAEMLHLYETYGYTGIMFYDDELNVNRGMVDLMRKIAATGIDWRLRGFVKAELFTEEQAEAMYAAGFRWLLCGFESGHPRILRNINKKATLEDNTRMVQIAHKHGLKVKALMSIGHPGESEETVYATRDWLLQEKPDDFDLTVITVYPGTPYYDGAVPCGDHYRYEFHGDALYSTDVDFTKDAAFYKGIPGEYHSFVWTDYLTAGELVGLRDEVEEHVRHKLAIPYPTAAAAVNYEHSMGQAIPQSILKGVHVQV